MVGLRLNSGVSLSGRSGCPWCGHKLSWYELVPVLSFLFLRGRCKECKSRISIQYPVIEILTGLVFVSLFIVFGLTPYFLLLTTVFSIYIAIVIYDFRHKIIPNNLIYPAIVLSLGFGIWRFVCDLDFGIWDLLAGPIIFSFFSSIWILSGGKAVGFGDAKLGLSLGLLLGARLGFSAIIMGFWLGAGIMLVVMLISRISGLLRGVKKLTMKSEIPFAPFLILGAWASIIYELNLLQIPY